MEGIGRTMGTLGVVSIAALALLILPGLASTASASPVPLGSTNSQQWAYGTQKWVNTTVDLPNATYSVEAFFGWQVVYTATNTSSTTVQLEAQRSMAGSFTAQICAPTCTNPTAQGNLSLKGWENDTGFANLTTTATVFENGSALPAVGLLNANSQVRGNITESWSYRLGTGSSAQGASASLSVAGSAHSAVNFSTPLGLVPFNATPGQTWNSSAAFTASGGWSVNASWERVTYLGAHLSGTPSASSSVQASGTVWLGGYDAGTVTLANGQTVPVIVLGWTGPFDDLDGAILVPHDFDLFGTASTSYQSESLGSETVATANLDLTVDASHHLRIVSAATSFGTSSTSLGVNQGVPSAGPVAASTTTSSPTVLQAQPESVAQAQQDSGCLASACNSGTSNGAHASSGTLGIALLVGLVVVVVVGSVSVIEYRVWAHKRAQQGISGTPSPVREAIAPPAGASYGLPPPSSGMGPRNPPGSP